MASSAGLKPPRPIVLGENMAAQWKNWIRQYLWFATATQLSDKPEEVQAATFMSAIGEDCVRIYDTFCLRPEEEQSVEIIRAKFDQYFTPKSCITFERYNFNQIVQREDEQFDNFVTRVREQAKKCSFSVLHDSLVKDRIIIGIKYLSLVPQLLNDDLTLQKTIELCRNFELTAMQSKALVGEAKVDIVKTAKQKLIGGRSDEKEEVFQCKKCGRKHTKRSCPAFGKTCRKCGSSNHFAAMCKSKSVVHSIQHSEKNEIDSDEDSDELFIGSVESSGNDKDWFEIVKVHNKKFSVKLDSGAHCNVVPLWLVKQLKISLRPSKTKWLVSFSNHRLQVLGEIDPVCRIKNKDSIITFKVVEESVVPVLGKETCIAQRLIARVDAVHVLDDTLYEGLGCLKDYVYDIDLISNPQWEATPARHVPHSIRAAVKNELDSMERLGVIERIHAPTPVVNAMVLVKRNEKIRICIDPSQVNKNLLRRHHPLTTVEEIATRLTNSKCFTILDCKKRFWQIRVTERTSKFLAFGTPWGRYVCKRLPFGLASAPEVFQKVMNDTLEGIEGVEISMDDILIHADRSEKLAKITEKVVKRLHSAGLKLNRDKCSFNQSSVKFLGHIVTDGGLKADPEKLEAVIKLKTPSNKSELQRALGMITYMGKFVPNLSDVTVPLRSLLAKDVDWDWGCEQENAFQKIKTLMQSPPILRYYDVNLPVTLSVDASSHALGAVLLQQGRPVAYASKALTPSELNYPQIEKEATAIRFACSKFHQYIYGKKLTIETDHKPLESIFRKPLDRAPPRLRRIRLEVAQYDPTVVYIKGTNIPIPDILSRDVDNSSTANNEEQLEVLLILQITKNASAELKHHTEADFEMQSLKSIIIQGWPETRNELLPELRKYWGFRDEMAVYDGLIFKSNQVLIPKSLRKAMLAKVHSGHSGIQSCIRRARQVLFWIGIGSDIHDMVEACTICQRHQRNNTKNTILLKDIPGLPFERVASDLFHFKGKEYLLLVDSYSGFFDIKQMPETTSKKVIKQLKEWFSVHGIPQVLETDNGPQYVSADFRQFCNKWGFEHQTSSPHFPRANGLAERYVQVAKSMLKKCNDDQSDIRLALLHMRNTPRSSSIPSPNERLMGRLVRSNMPMTQEALRPRVAENVQHLLEREREIQKDFADRGSMKPPQFIKQEKVLIQDQTSRRWTPGTVVKQLDENRSYIVTDGERTLRRNTHHLRKLRGGDQKEENIQESVQPAEVDPDDNRSEIAAETSNRNQSSLHFEEDVSATPRLTRSGRTVKPKRLNEFEYY
ncbi:uncharacterized protein K02A2.6-like [Topomyia yanbarensis]|uniref:uncharacterized protein K02A2.6-like n=1 Tax=Topomyia yanbarensis TaxID=2498891 RepID=UPI00273AAD1E|nr:uncharacterized protein K02A2.6-like [Topomyia yanbarensis]